LSTAGAGVESAFPAAACSDRINESVGAKRRDEAAWPPWQPDGGVGAWVSGHRTGNATKGRAFQCRLPRPPLKPRTEGLHVVAHVTECRHRRAVERHHRRCHP
jgi:hypothetical protein